MQGYPPKDEPRLKPIDVPCTYCGAQAGRMCNPLALFDEAAFGGHHITRDHNAKLASKAAEALDPRPRPWKWSVDYSLPIIYGKSVIKLDTIT